jgi:hypothetical protein
VYQRYHSKVVEVLETLLATYVKLTKCQQNSVALYDATTDSTNSLIGLYFG